MTIWWVSYSNVIIRVTTCSVPADTLVYLVISAVLTVELTVHSHHWCHLVPPPGQSTAADYSFFCLFFVCPFLFVLFCLFFFVCSFFFDSPFKVHCLYSILFLSLRRLVHSSLARSGFRAQTTRDLNSTTSQSAHFSTLFPLLH